jgi:hypothetical protein
MVEWIRTCTCNNCCHKVHVFCSLTYETHLFWAQQTIRGSIPSTDKISFSSSKPPKHNHEYRNYMNFSILLIQPFADWRQGCVPPNLTRVEFYVSRNFPKCLCSTRSYTCWNWLKQKRLISKENIIKHPLLPNLIRFISIYFLRDAYVFPAGKNLRRRIYVTRVLRKSGRAVFLPTLASKSSSAPYSRTPTAYVLLW